MRAFLIYMQYLRVLPFVAVFAVILFSGLKPEPVPQVFDQQDKIHHLLGFAAFAFTMRMAFPRVHFVWALGSSIAAALLIEIVQGFLPNRMASSGDMVANTLGVFLGWGCSLVAQSWLRQRFGDALTEEATAPRS